MGAILSQYLTFESCEYSSAWRACLENVQLLQSVAGIPAGRSFSSCVIDLEEAGTVTLYGWSSRGSPPVIILELTPLLQRVDCGGSGGSSSTALMAVVASEETEEQQQHDKRSRLL